MTTLFYMWEPFRELLIQGHLFYVEQSKKRLLSQFDNLEAEADKYAADWLNERDHLFDPHKHDPGDFQERAYDESLGFYQMLSDMRNRTILSIIAAIFHEWDKQLRDWLVKEVMHWHSGEAVKQAIWKVNFDDIIDFVDMALVKTKNTNHYLLLDKYRLLVNAYKHGEGDSFRELLSKHKEFFNPVFENQFEYGFFNYESIVVKDEHLDECSGAIVEFWKSIPQYVHDSDEIDIPNWFEKACKKGQ
jgi:hypothetical protein